MIDSTEKIRRIRITNHEAIVESDIITAGKKLINHQNLAVPDFWKTIPFTDEIIEYDLNGNIILHGGENSLSLYLYNKSGKITEEMSLSFNNDHVPQKIATCRKYEYDVNGVLLKEILYNDNGIPYLSKMKYYDDGLLAKDLTIESQSDFLEDRIFFQYDSKKKLIKEIRFIGEILSLEIFYSYNQSGTLEKVVKNTPTSCPPPYNKEFPSSSDIKNYDKMGRLIGESYRNQEILINTMYNELGLVIFQNYKSLRYSFESTYEYEYDCKGNWIKKIINRNYKPFMVELRTIEYF